MRQSRLSGSVEGVMGNHDSYSDLGSPSPATILLPHLKMALGHLKTPATRAMILGVIYANGVGTPNAHKSSVFMGKHRNELAASDTVRAPDDERSISSC